MKKVFAIFLTIILTLCGFSAFAEDFTLRNGIHFGDSPDDIKEKETLTIRNDIDRKSALGANNEWLMDFEGTATGIDNVLTIFYFDEEQKLVDMVYYYEQIGHNVPVTMDLYDKLKQSLTEKYGKPLDIPEGKQYAISGKAMSAFSKLGVSPWLALTEWVIPCDDYYVKIELVIGVELFYQKTGVMFLGYHRFYQPELDAVIQEINEQEEAMKNDI